MAGIMSERSIHLIDIENLARWPRPSRAAVRRAAGAYAEAAPIGNRDLVVIACNHGAALEVGLSWPTAHRLIARSGRDGADRALLDVIAHEAIASRFERVVIGSGDGAFADAAAGLAAAGVDVTVVGPEGGLSTALCLAAHRSFTIAVPAARIDVLGGAA